MMKWVRIEDERPKHRQTVLAYSLKGICVCVFIDSLKMNIELCEKGYPEEQVDTKQIPYYFCSQEIKGNTLNGVTHWMKDLELPK